MTEATAPEGTGARNLLNALILTVFVDFTGQMGSTAIHCDFPGATPEDKPIRVVLDPHPSLKDQPGLYRVMMDLNGLVSLKAAAQPIQTTEDRDILIRGARGKAATFTIGLRDDGRAAFNMQTRGAEDANVKKSTRIGACRGYEAHLNKWLPL